MSPSSAPSALVICHGLKYRSKKRRAFSAPGFGVRAALLNVDALYVLGRLTTDRAFREVVVSAASKVEPPTSAASGSPLVRAHEARGLIDAVGMPVGWREARHGLGTALGVVPVQMCKPPKDVAMDTTCEDSRYSYGRAMIGWLVTAFAVMLGARFWFDVLNSSWSYARR